jgi:hypothetical protein
MRDTRQNEFAGCIPVVQVAIENDPVVFEGHGLVIPHMENVNVGEEIASVPTGVLRFEIRAWLGKIFGFECLVIHISSLFSAPS